MVEAVVRVIGPVFERYAVVAVEERENNGGESAGGLLRYINFCPSSGQVQGCVDYPLATNRP
jgi:hypothetical protein